MTGVQTCALPISLALLVPQGMPSLREARVSRIYEIKGPLSANQVQQATKDLLCDAADKAIQLLRIERSGGKPHS